jgi:Leucine-rich repeat (LRR) protein
LHGRLIHSHPPYIFICIFIFAFTASLRILSLGRNNIKKIEKLDDVSGSLEELWLSYNLIEKLDGLAACKKLRVLYISNNKIANFAELNKLVCLSCSILDS